MSHLQRLLTIRWFTNPAELRKIADDMEKKWASSLGGENLTVFSVMREKPIGEAAELEIVIDQDAMRRTPR